MQPISTQEFDEAVGGNRAFLYGLICGAAVGAMAGLLFAPKPGNELRTQVNDSAQRLRRRAGEVYDEASRAVSDAVAKGRRAFEQSRETAMHARSADARKTPVDVPVL